MIYTVCKHGKVIYKFFSKCCFQKKKSRKENIIVIEPQQNRNPFNEFQTPPRKTFKKSKKSPSEEEKVDLTCNQGSSNKKLGLSESEQPHFVKPFEFSLDLELSSIGINLPSLSHEKKSQRYFFNVSPEDESISADPKKGFSFPVRVAFLTEDHHIKIYFPREIPKVKFLFNNLIKFSFRSNGCLTRHQNLL